ncbi:MAG TPA: polysaccharide deacetylase family protein [Glycomyces sp.]|nr:polysaccharide deacetylase family protein [Glycomyces sp.]
MRRHKLGIAAAVAILLALAWVWPEGGEPPLKTSTATEPTAPAAPVPAGEADREPEDTGTTGAAHVSAEPSEPASPPAEPEPVASHTPAVEPVANNYGGPLGTRDQTGTDAIALTFDDGPAPEWTRKVLDMLRERGVKATFCVIGAYAEAYPELIADIAREGHTLCNHSWYHEFDLGKWSETELRANLQRTNDAILKAAPGAEVAYFRQPGGRWTDRAIAVAADLGMESLHWTVDPSDWDSKTSEAEIRDRVVGRTAPGSIVLLHDGASNQQEMCGALESILDAFDRRGYAYSAL